MADMSTGELQALRKLLNEGHEEEAEEDKASSDDVRTEETNVSKEVLSTNIYSLQTTELTLVNQIRCEWDNAESVALRLIQDCDINLRARLKDMIAHGQEKDDGCIVVPHRRHNMQISAVCPIGCPKSMVSSRAKAKGKHKVNIRTCIVLKIEECIQGSGGIEATKELLNQRGNNQLLEVHCNSNMS